MSAADWGTLIPAIVGVLGALAAYLKSRAAKQSADAAHARLNATPGAPTKAPK